MDAIWITALAASGSKRLAVKDLFDTAGVRTTYGSAIFSDYVPATSATAVTLLEAAGWTTAGKANLHEFAYGVTSQNLHYGVVPNPAFPGRTAGGSSGGSAAAIAFGAADGALDTDTGGSIRIPAACCGIAGFKPTYGLISTDGIFPLAPSFDHAGPMARDVGGCVELLRALAPSVTIDRLGDVRMGVAWADRCDPMVRARVLEAAAFFGDLAAVDFPTAEAVAPAFMREVGDVHRELYPENSDLYGENIKDKVERCLAVGDVEVAAATTARAELAERAEQALEGLDLLVTPTLAFVAPPADVVELEVRASFVQFTFPFNALGWPVLALPVGPADDGLPASVQIVGRPGTDGLVLAAGLALEAGL